MPVLLDNLRAKYPGAYDDLSDTDLAQKLVAKHPVYAADLQDVLKPVSSPKDQTVSPPGDPEAAALRQYERRSRGAHAEGAGSEMPFTPPPASVLPAPIMQAALEGGAIGAPRGLLSAGKVAGELAAGTLLAEKADPYVRKVYPEENLPSQIARGVVGQALTLAPGLGAEGALALGRRGGAPSVEAPAAPEAAPPAIAGELTPPEPAVRGPIEPVAPPESAPPAAAPVPEPVQPGISLAERRSLIRSGYTPDLIDALDQRMLKGEAAPVAKSEVANYRPPAVEPPTTPPEAPQPVEAGPPTSQPEIVPPAPVQAPPAALFGRKAPAASPAAGSEAVASQPSLLASERGSVSPFAESDLERAYRQVRESRAAAGVGDPLENLTTQLRQHPAGEPAKRLKLSERLAAQATGTKDAIKYRLGQAQASGAAMVDSIKRPYQHSDFHSALGVFQRETKTADVRMAEFGKEVNRRFPNPARQEAITNYIQAGGDDAILAKRAGKSAGTPKLQAGYEAARTLAPAERAFADEVVRYNKRSLQQLIDADVVEQGRDNFVHQVWDLDNPVSRRKVSEGLTRGGVQPNPNTMYHRVFDSYFEGEQAGYTPKHQKSIGYTTAIYDHAKNQALASRAFIESVKDAKAADGRSSLVFRDPRWTHASPAELAQQGIDPSTRVEMPEDIAAHYQPLNHPAFRNYLVHVDEMPKFKAAFGRSAIREQAWGRGLLSATSGMRNLRVALSPFHPSQVAGRAIFHGVNPFHLEPIDLEHPLTKAIMEHGWESGSAGGLEQWHEGVHASGIVDKIPILGPLNHKLGNWIFGHDGFISRSGHKIAQEMVETNTDLYGDPAAKKAFADMMGRPAKATSRLTRMEKPLAAQTRSLGWDEILDKSSHEANSTFGTLNWKYLGRNPTTVDALRVLQFAPQWTEATLRSVGQAFTPQGAMQRAALIRAAASLYFGARIFNQVADGDPHWDRPFSGVYKGQEYTIRAIPTDFYHLISDPRSFLYHRLSPVISGGIELGTARDAYGHLRDLWEQLGDIAPIPISLEGINANLKDMGVPVPHGLVNSRDRHFWQSMLQGVGLSSWKYLSAAEKTAMQASGHMDQLPAERRAQQQKNLLRERLKQDPVAGEQELRRRVMEGDLTAKDAATLFKQSSSHQLELIRSVRSVKDVGALLDIWSRATPDERRNLEPVFRHRIATGNLVPKDKASLAAALRPETPDVQRDAVTH